MKVFYNVSTQYGNKLVTRLRHSVSPVRDIHPLPAATRGVPSRASMSIGGRCGAIASVIQQPSHGGCSCMLSVNLVRVRVRVRVSRPTE